MEKHKWEYCSLGGVVRVNISTGEDIAHLGELDEKYWTVLSCPVAGLDIDSQTLACLDTDSDGKIRVKEVVAAAQWLCSCVTDPDLLLKGSSEFDTAAFNEATVEGAGLKKSAKQILENLGKGEGQITVADASDSVAIFKGTKFNGDGVITPISAGEDAELKDIISDCIATVGSVTDRSGEPGVTAELIDKFYTACEDYSSWQAAAEASKDGVFPYGDSTAAAYSACGALKAKMADYFMRCKLLKFDETTAAALEVKITATEDLGSCPIARPAADGVLSLKAVNPAWEGAVAALLAIVPEKDFSDKAGITETSWKAFCSKFDAYSAWLAAKKGAEVEALGLEKINSVLKADRHADLLNLVADDAAKKEESDSIDKVKKFMFLYRDFNRFLRNYVIFTDFYNRSHHNRAMFEAGKLYIDQRCCDLCIKVTDMTGHNDMAKLSGMFLIYCRCASKIRTETLDIVAVLTAGETGDLRPGKNGIFYDLQGRDWDATITKVVDNPISIATAFWSPYKKFWDFCVGLISKQAEEKDSKVMKEMQEKATQSLNNQTNAPADASKSSPFDIAKFAGIFAALGMALGYIGSFLTQLWAGITTAPLWQLLVAIIAIMLVISGPSCFIAWGKLRKRNLGPVLNANGWAMNANVLVNILFGNKLTSVAKYPKLKISDPYRQKNHSWKWLTSILVIAIAALALWFFVIKPCRAEKAEAAKQTTEQTVGAPADANASDPADANTPAPAAAQ